jgi:hypothetical protein
MTGDLTHTLPTNIFLTVIEQQLAIITISIPMLRPLYRAYRDRYGGYSIGENAKASGNSGGAGQHSDIVTFGGSGKQGSNANRRGAGKSVVDTAVELRDVEYKTAVNAVKDDRRSDTSDWVPDDSGSETRLGAWPKNHGAISVRNEWEVSRA